MGKDKFNGGIIGTIILTVAGAGFGAWAIKKQKNKEEKFQKSLRSFLSNNLNLCMGLKDLKLFLREEEITRSDKYNKYHEIYENYQQAFEQSFDLENLFISKKSYNSSIIGVDEANNINQFLKKNNNFSKLFITIMKEYNINIQKIIDDIMEIDKNSIIDINKYIIKEFETTRAGIEAEERVKNEISKCGESLKNISNKRLELDNKINEYDDIVICDKGIFILEVKNIGGNSDSILHISKDGKWTKEYNNRIELIDKTGKGYSPTSQVYLRTMLLKNFIEKELDKKGYSINDEAFKPFIVLANDNININDESDTPIIRISEIYHKIYNGYSILSKDLISEIYKIIMKLPIIEEAKFKTKIPDDNFINVVESNYKLLKFVKELDELITKF